MSDDVRVRAVTPADEAAWSGLWADYCAFYKVALPPGVTAGLWGRLLDPASPVHGLLAVDEAGVPLALCHYVLHPHTWSMALLCYLEDLYTRQDLRGRGAGRALIDHLRAQARDKGWRRIYWHTEAGNETARRLYDKVAGGCDPVVRYSLEMTPP